jgi:hypothetical protein
MALSGIVAAFAAWSTAPAPNDARTDRPRLADLNGDGHVNVLDVHE